MPQTLDSARLAAALIFLLAGRGRVDSQRRVRPSVTAELSVALDTPIRSKLRIQSGSRLCPLPPSSPLWSLRYPLQCPTAMKHPWRCRSATAIQEHVRLKPDAVKDGCRATFPIPIGIAEGSPGPRPYSGRMPGEKLEKSIRPREWVAAAVAFGKHCTFPARPPGADLSVSTAGWSSPSLLDPALIS